MTGHAERAKEFVADERRMHWHDQAVWFVRNKRDVARSFVPEWEELRSLGSQIKAHTLSRLPDYLEQFEKNATANGARVHWARDADEHNEIVHGILREHRVTRVVKSKSMLTEECHLNEYLEEQGIEIVDTDLGERIVQFRREPPSHIVMPAIHLKKEEIAETFAAQLGTEPGVSDPITLVAAARGHLRERFLDAQAALTGVNFAIAETGGVVVCTNEGNADLGVALAPIHIASMGIEKMIPGTAELAVFLRLLARSGTGQRITVYTTHVHRPRAGQELHIVLVDNGRTTQLGRDGFWRSLKCIRCGACMNTCPVYRRSGGHSYGSTVPGPIGSVLTPGIDLEKYASLPFASTLCGSCTAVCPVKIDLDAQLYRWRQIAVDAGYVSGKKRGAAVVAAKILARPRLFALIGRATRVALRILPRSLVAAVAAPWSRDRDVPSPASQTFRAWYKANRASRRAGKRQ